MWRSLQSAARNKTKIQTKYFMLQILPTSSLVNSGRFNIQVLSTIGTTTYSQETHKLKKGKFSTDSAKYSMDVDGTFNKMKGTGDFNVTQYDCRNVTIKKLARN